jgi:hypothetical protein
MNQLTSRTRRIVALTCMFLLGCGVVGGAGPAFASEPQTGGLSIVVSGLPTGVAANARVSGPRHFRQKVRESVELSQLTPGVYTISVRTVRIKHAQGGIPARSTALPVASTITVEVGATSSSTAHVEYGTIQNPNVTPLAGTPIEVSGPATDPATIVVPGAGHPKLGAILTQAPSSTLPAGLFDEVTAVTVNGAQATLGLRPATLVEAFPKLDVHTSFPLAPAPSGPAPARVKSTSAHGAGLSPLEVNLGSDFLSCGGSLEGEPSFSDHQAFSVNDVFELEYESDGLGIPTGVNGEALLTLSGSTSLSFSAPAGAHCGGTLPEPALAGVIPGIDVPVYAKLSEQATAQATEDLHVEVNAGLSLSGGVLFSGDEITPIASAKPEVSASSSGAGEITVGPSLQLGVGLDAVANVHLGLNPALAFTEQEPSCSLGLQENLNAGVSLGPVEFSEPLEALEQTLFTCTGSEESNELEEARRLAKEKREFPKLIGTGTFTIKASDFFGKLFGTFWSGEVREGATFNSSAIPTLVYATMETVSPEVPAAAGRLVVVQTGGIPIASGRTTGRELLLSGVEPLEAGDTSEFSYEAFGR